MTKDDMRKFKTKIMGAGEIYDKPINNALLDIYFTALMDFSLEEVSAAMTAHLVDPDQGAFFPKPANLVRQIKGTSKDHKRSIENRGEIAWAQIMAYVEGPHDLKIKLDDKQAAAALMANGGISRLKVMEHKDVPWMKKEFLCTYDTYENTNLEHIPTNVLGYQEMENQRIESKQGMKSIVEIANQMIETETKPEPVKLTHEQGQANAADLVALFNKNEGKSPAQIKREEELERAAKLKQDFHNKHGKQL